MSQINPLPQEQEIVLQPKVKSIIERLQLVMQQGIAGQAHFTLKLAGKCADATVLANCKVS